MELVDFVANSQVVFVGVSFEFCGLPVFFEFWVGEGFSGFHERIGQLELSVIKKRSSIHGAY